MSSPHKERASCGKTQPGCDGSDGYRPSCMPGGRARESCAQQRSLHPFFLVGVHAPELNLKRPGHCALSLSRVRARVLQAIAPPTLPGGCNILRLKKGGCATNEERCYASGNEGCSVIQACRPLAGPEIPFVAIPNH